MFENIETKEEKETLITRSLALTLTEAEVNAILIDPRKFQKALRTARNAWYGTEAKWSATGHGPNADGLPRKGKTKPTQKAGKTSEKKIKAASAPQICPHCRESFKRLAKHLPSCPERTASGVPLSEE
jgi:hypothetical protein